MASTDARVFLTAEWRDLLMLNYEVAPELLRGYVPRGTQLDSFRGRTYVSLVGFRFRKTKLRGKLSVPLHSNFEEINLRFYVRREAPGELRRGVVFIAEIVPRLAIAKTARWLYGENYVSRRMKHSLETKGSRKVVEYRWKTAEGWCALRARTEGDPRLPEEGSLEQFISEHYWGYSAQKQGGAVEYRVEHVPWKLWTGSDGQFAGDPGELYGRKFSEVLRKPPDSAFVAEGSAVSVYDSEKIA